MAESKERIDVLIVEDEKDDVVLMIREIRNGGFDPYWESVQTSEDFTRALQSRQWDVILADYSMPRFGCSRALEILKDSGRDIPFIIVSGVIGEETAVNLMVSGAADFILKSNLVRLVPAIRRELKEFLNREERRSAEKREVYLNALLRSIRDLNKLIVEQNDRESLILSICNSLVSNREFQQVLIILSQEGEKGFSVYRSSLSEGENATRKEQLKDDEIPCCVSFADESEDAISFIDVEPFCTDCSLCNDELDVTLVIRIVHHGRKYGYLCISVPKGFGHDFKEQEFLLEIADDIALALNRIETAIEREEAERALRAERRHLQKVIRGSYLGIWIWDPKSDEIILNDIWASRLGYNLQELTPFTIERWKTFVHPDDLDEVIQRMSRCVRGEADDYECEVRMRHKDGHYVWMLDRASMMTRDDEDLSRAMFGTQSDITLLKKAQQQLAAREHELQAAQEVAHLGNWSLDIATDNVQWSPSLYKMYGFDPSLPVPPYHEHMKLFTPESWELLSTSLARTTETGKPYEVELEMVRDGRAGGWMWARGEVVRDTAGQIIGLRGVAQDITERKQLEQQIRQAQRLDAVGLLAGGVAHDFNNLLMGIMGYTELCREEIDKDHPVQEYLDAITKEAERSANIVRQLLAFSRKQTISPQILDLNNVVADMLKMLQRLISEDIELIWNPGDDLKPVLMDPGQIDQILANLCVNARDAIFGVGTIIIETRNVQIDEEYCLKHTEIDPGEYVMLAVTDDGSGMDDDTLTNIFEPFFTTKEEGKGTGLGLATVYGIVKQNHGSIHVYSEPGQGTTFRIFLPHADEYLNDQVDEDQENEDKIHGTETIILVEDEDSVRLTLSVYLKDLGYHVLSAEDPLKAFDIAQNLDGTIDAVITDVIMPNMNGKEFVEKLRTIHPDFKVLYISGYPSDVIVDRGILEKGVEFLPKPLMRDALARKIRNILDNDR